MPTIDLGKVVGPQGPQGVQANLLDMEVPIIDTWLKKRQGAIERSA